MTRRSDGDNEDNDPDHASFQSTDSYGLNGDSTHAGDLTHEEYCHLKREQFKHR